MRVLLVSIAALALATPAMAHDTERKAAAAAEMLNDPAVQDAAADSLSDAVSAMLDIRVGAFDPLGGRRSDTLRDRMDRDDPYFEQRIHRNARHATRAAGVMADEFAGMIPELRARLARVKHRLQDERYDDRGYGNRAYDDRVYNDADGASSPLPPRGDDNFGDWDD